MGHFLPTLPAFSLDKIVSPFEIKIVALFDLSHDFTTSKQDKIISDPDPCKGKIYMQE